MRYILILAAVLLCASASADGWNLDLKLHNYNQLSDTMGRLSKDFGKLKLSALARTFDDGANEGNHLNVSIAGSWFGAELLTGEHIRSDLRSFSVMWPAKKKPTVYQTPCESVFHVWAQKEFDGGFFSANFYDKDGIPEAELHVRVEF